jgi:hypothetical protein
MSSPPWHCRPSQSGDEQGILALYRDVFGLELTVAFWRWMYQESPAGPSIIVLVEQAGRIVGHYAVQLREFWHAGRRTVVGMPVATMLHPSARNVSTMVSMAQLAYELCRDRSIPWLYCFPNEVAFRVRCGLLGWNALPDLVEWDGPLPRLTGEFAGGVGWRADLPEDVEFDCFSPPGAGIVSATRSAEWLRWRFFRRPGGEFAFHALEDDGRVVGYAVTKRYNRDGVRYGHLVDWQLGPSGAGRGPELLASVWSQLAKWNVERVSCWARGEPELSRLLAAAGLAQVGRATRFVWLDLSGSSNEVLRNPEAWRIEMAESDVY